jgi:hypothetical protein
VDVPKDHLKKLLKIQTLKLATATHQLEYPFEEMKDLMDIKSERSVNLKRLQEQFFPKGFAMEEGIS